MEYTAVAYVLMALVLVGYAANLRRRSKAVERERARLESTTGEQH